MTVTERVAYLKGLFEGLGIDSEKKEGRVLKGMLEALEELALSVTDLEQQNAEMADELDDVFEELSALQEEQSGNCDAAFQDDAYGSDEELYQLTCPTCEETLFISEDTLNEGSMRCPACGESLEFDLSALDAVAWDDDSSEGETSLEPPADMATDINMD